MKLLEHRFGYGLTIGILVLCGFAAVLSLQFRAVSLWFPFFVGVTGALLATLVLIVDLVGDRRIKRGFADPIAADPIDRIEIETGLIALHDDSDEDEPARSVLVSFTRYLAWLVCFVVLFLFFGMPIAVFVWLLLFVRFVAKESWLRAVFSAVIMAALLFVLSAFLNLALPEGLLIDSSAFVPHWRF
jgi:hypothetical protein